MAEIGDKVIVPTTKEVGFVVYKDADFYYVALDGKNAVCLVDSVIVHPDNEELKEMCTLMCD